MPSSIEPENNQTSKHVLNSRHEIRFKMDIVNFHDIYFTGMDEPDLNGSSPNALQHNCMNFYIIMRLESDSILQCGYSPPVQIDSIELRYQIL